MNHKSNNTQEERPSLTGGGRGGSLRSTLAVSLNNYLDAGAIVAGSSGITLWQNYLGILFGRAFYLGAYVHHIFCIQPMGRKIHLRAQNISTLNDCR